MNRRFLLLSALFLCGALSAPAQLGIFKHKLAPTKATPENPLAGDTSKQPDKELFVKAMAAMDAGKFDVARLDLQTLLNTYPESEYQMRAKLAVGDTWFKEGGAAALTQDEAEYKDFITFFPNAPEAAEAQMKVADIYFTQMEKPDRDPTNANRAEQEYRTMIQQFPDSPLIPRAKQKLREVQEVLADRQYDVGTFYASHENWSATIARLQTLTDEYPLYSHSDLALIALGDAYAAEARQTQLLNMTPAAKQEMMKAFDDRAADAYDRVVTRYATSPHVEDARERLIALNRPIPDPTPAQLAESESEEQSRIPITLKDRAIFLVKSGPVTISAARVGEPTMSDPPVVTAPQVNQENSAMYTAAIAGKPIPSESLAPAGALASAPGAENQTPAGDSGAPLQLESVPSAGEEGGGPAVGAQIVGTGAAGDSTGADPGANNNGNAPPGSAQTGTTSNGTASTGAASAEDAAGAAAAADAAGVPGAQNQGGLQPVGQTGTQALPPVEQPAAAAPQTNDVHGPPSQVQTGTNTGAAQGKKKAPAPKYNSKAESSSKHKQKTDLQKMNPF